MSVQFQHRRDSNAVIETVTPAAAELGFDTTKKEALIGDASTQGGIRLAKKNVHDIVIAAQITSNQNDYNPANLKHAGTLIISTDVSRNITGLVPTTVTDATDGREITIYNGGSANAVLQDQNASSSAANRFDLGGADVTLGPKQSLTLRYRTQGALNRWEIAASTAGQSVGDGSISARKLAASALGMAMINGVLVPSVAGSALTVAIKTLAGNDPSAADPVYVLERNATAATGDFSVMTLTAATSLVISSGSSLGVSGNNTAFKVWIVGFNDAGTFRLAAVNCLSGMDIMPLSAWGIASSTAEGGAGAADNAQTFYTGTAVTSKPYAVLGYMTWETGLAAVGTWSAGPTRTQLFGYGVALPGTEVQRVRSSTGALATGTVGIPFDDTIPQNTEGDQYMSKAITPSSAANLLDINSQALLCSSIAAHLQMALFQDSNANALVANDNYQPTAATVLSPNLRHKMLAATTSSTTFKIRAGAHTTGTTTFNGQSGLRIYGGVANSYLEITEIAT